MYVRSDLPQRRRNDLEPETMYTESGRVEVLVMEVILNGEKWFYSSVYKKPTVKSCHFIVVLQSVFDKCLHEQANFIASGDFNTNMLNKGECITDLLYICGLKNIVTKPTCHKNREQPTLIDLIVTNVPKRLKSVTNVDTGLSDYHDILCVATKMCIPVKKRKHIMYRSYKKFDKKMSI